MTADEPLFDEQSSAQGEAQDQSRSDLGPTPALRNPPPPHPPLSLLFPQRQHKDMTASCPSKTLSKCTHQVLTACAKHVNDLM